MGALVIVLYDAACCQWSVARLLLLMVSLNPVYTIQPVVQPVVCVVLRDESIGTLRLNSGEATECSGL